MNVRDFAKRLRETPMTCQGNDRLELPLSIVSTAFREKIQVLYCSNCAGSEEIRGEDNELLLVGCFGKPGKKMKLIRCSLDLPALYREHCCEVQFYQGRMIDMKPEENHEANQWFEQWLNLAKKTGCLREVTCYFNLDSGSILHSDFFPLWESAGKPTVWMTTNIKNSVLTELFDEGGKSVGIAMVYPYRSLIQGQTTYLSGQIAHLPVCEFVS